MNFLRLEKNNKKLFCNPALPSSKSLSTRILILNHLYPELISCERVSEADDVHILKENLKAIDECAGSDIPYVLNCKNSGAVLRFLTALTSAGKGKYLITGDKRLQMRPVHDLFNALQAMDADISYAGEPGYCPLIVKGKTLNGGKVLLNSTISSQYVSALLLVANEFENGIELILTGNPASEKFILLTIDILRKAGIKILYRNNRIKVTRSVIRPVHYSIENDWASASFWYLMLMLAEEGQVVFHHLLKSSLLPEAELPQLFLQLGISTAFYGDEVHIYRSNTSSDDSLKYDFTANPDLALPLIMAAAFSGREAVFSGLENLQYKESDRFAALIEILEKLNIAFTRDGKKGIQLHASTPLLKKNTIFDGRNDHRLIMTLAALAQHFNSGIIIKNYSGVDKSYPQFWLDMSRAGFTIKESAR